MQGHKNRRSNRLITWVIVLIAIIGSSCAPKLSLRIEQPAEVDTAGIRNVAIGNFELMTVRRTSKIERNGQWQTHHHDFSPDQKKALSNQIRARVINLLSTTPYFRLNYTDEFKALETDSALQQAIAAGGFRTTDVDAVISGKVWLDVVRNDGVEIDVAELEYVQGGRRGTFNYLVETVVYWPYKSIRGTMGLEMKLTRLNPDEVISVSFDTRQASYKIGGKPGSYKEKLLSGVQMAESTLIDVKGRKDTDSGIENSDLVLPNFEQMVADLAESIAAQFVRSIAVTQKFVTYPIATGGNETGRLLIEAGAYEMAIETLTRVLDQAAEKNPDDLYNLGLCYEATGDYGLAEVVYNDAIKIEPEDYTYALGLGRMERLKRENRQLRRQLSTKITTDE